jgi:hypothetical protein
MEKQLLLRIKKLEQLVVDLFRNVRSGTQQAGAVLITGNQSIEGAKTFENIGFPINVAVRNFNTQPGSTALSSITANGGIGIYSNSLTTGFCYVGANNGATTFSVNRTGDVTGSKFIMTAPLSNDYATDALAAAGGIPVGGLYHTAGVVKIRLT